MTITATDIKLLASERMTDTTDGGGRRTGNVIPDGVAGNIFQKVSRLDGVYGRVNLRKIYCAVQTATLDTYAGAHAVVMDAPDNDRIVINLMSTGSDFDDRTAARDRIESYVIAGPESRMTLYGRQLIGQGAISAYQHADEPLPEVGEVFCLSSETGAVINAQQYVRITDVTHDLRTFEDTKGEFKRRVVTMKISTPLRYEFTGPDSADRNTSAARPALLRRTSVADAARYFGIQPLTEVAASGALEVRAASVYSPIVPTTQRETAISNAELSGASTLLAAAAAPIPSVTFPYYSWPQVNSDTTQVRLPCAIVPGSLTFIAHMTMANSGPSNAQYGYTDDGEGVLTNTFLVASGVNVPAAIDYETGIITFTRPTAIYIGWEFSVAYTPAALVSQVAHTRSNDITLATRGTVFVETLHPLPMPGSLMVDYRALGKWYRLRDDGTGALVGDDPAYGTGSVDYVTGAVIASIGALPDVGSRVLMAWASPTHYAVKAGATSDAGTALKQRIQLDQLPVKVSSVVITYTAGVTTYTATETAGVISGGGITGTVNRVTGVVDIEYTTRLPNMGTGVSVAYVQQAATDPVAAPKSVSGSFAFANLTNIVIPATGSALSPNGVALTLSAQIPGSGGFNVLVDLVDDGSGNLLTVDKNLNTGGNVIMHEVSGQNVGTINYATGAINISVAAVNVVTRAYVQTTSAWDTPTVAFPLQTGNMNYTVTTVAASADSAKTFVANPLTNSPIKVDLTRTTLALIVPGSVLFTFSGKQYVDRSGVMYTDLQSNGSATVAGSVDYVTGDASISYWADNTTLDVSVQACLLSYGSWKAVDAVFRTAGSPLRAESGYVQVTAEDGTLITATSDADGFLVSSKARGKINNEMGVVAIQWGEMVVAAGNESADWYDVANVVGANVWKPTAVFPGTLRYNGVVLSNLPLNADILGLDPVRLPSDGRVPIFRPADVVVIHNTQSVVLPNPPVASATYNMGRVDLSELWLLDATGARVAASKYVVDLAAGTTTMDAALDLTGVPLPITAKHRIEQVAMLSDVQINGQLSLSSPLAREYGAGSYVSSALLFGDMFARASNLFDQVTWDGTWQDTRRGSNATAEYNSVDYPIAMKNDAAVTERWRINFTGTTTFQVIGENLGVIANGTTGADLAPVNALTGKVYFTLSAAGWGAGWAVGNQLRFNTIGATGPVWVARTVLPGATLNGDSFDLQLRGDVDA